MNHPEIREDEKSTFERAGTQRLLWIALWALCAASAIGGFVLAATGGMYPHFTFDRLPVFYGVMGFGAFSFIVLVGQHLRKILMRPENYYQDNPSDSGPGAAGHGHAHHHKDGQGHSGQ